MALNWQPANDVERALNEAMVRDSVDDFRAILGAATLHLPVPPGVTRGDSDLPWPTATAPDGRTFILAYTSAESMQTGATVPYGRTVPFADVAHAWPAADAWLAVNLGTPLQAVFDAEAVARTAWMGERTSYPLDAALRAAIRVNDQAAYALVLLAADLAVPVAPDAPPLIPVDDSDFGWWRSTTPDGAPVIVAYSTPQRLQADLGDVHYVVTDMTHVLAAWPQDGTALAVNPGMPIAGLISGPAMVGLADWVLTAAHAAQEAADAAVAHSLAGDHDRELIAFQAARDTVTALLRSPTV